MQTVMAEFSGRRAGYFRPKPISKIGGHKPCPRCGKYGHLGRTTCEVKTLPDNWRDVLPANAPRQGRSEATYPECSGSVEDRPCS